MGFVLEAHLGSLDDSGAFDINAVGAVDHYVTDRRVLKERLDRSQSRHLVQDFSDEIVQFLRIEHKALGHDIYRDELGDVLADLFLRHFIQRRKIDLFNQTLMQSHFGVEQLLLEERTGPSSDFRTWLSFG